MSNPCGNRSVGWSVDRSVAKGDAPDGVYILLSGDVDVHMREADDGAKSTAPWGGGALTTLYGKWITRLPAGSLFGELAISGDDRSPKARAESIIAKGDRALVAAQATRRHAAKKDRADVAGDQTWRSRLTGGGSAPVRGNDDDDDQYAVTDGVGIAPIACVSIAAQRWLAKTRQTACEDDEDLPCVAIVIPSDVYVEQMATKTRRLAFALGQLDVSGRDTKRKRGKEEMKEERTRHKKFRRYPGEVES